MLGMTVSDIGKRIKPKGHSKFSSDVEFLTTDIKMDQTGPCKITNQEHSCLTMWRRKQLPVNF